MVSLLVSYDISKDSLRKKAAERLIDIGLVRIKYSVYLGTLSENTYAHTLSWLHQLQGDERWSPTSDSVLAIRLLAGQVKDMQVIGLPKWDREDLDNGRLVVIL